MNNLFRTRAVRILVLWPAGLLGFGALAFFLLFGWPWPPSDDEMIAVFNERRPALEALVAKVREGPGSGVITPRWTDHRVKEGPWLDEVRALMRDVGAQRVYFAEHGEVDVVYRVGGVFGSWYKGLNHRRRPRHPPPQPIDLDGEDAAARARAALCDPDRPPDLRHLCKDGIVVSTLDILLDVDDGSSAWTAERPIDEHWSVGLMYIP